MKREFVAVWVVAVILAGGVGAGGEVSPVSRTITEVLRDPLPSEDLSCLPEGQNIIVQGPTFRYRIDRKTGGITALETVRQGQTVVALQNPIDLRIDDARLAASHDGATRIVAQGKDKVIVATEGVWADGLRYVLESTFYNDGVAVSEVKLKPDKDFSIRKGIQYQVSATGRFSQYLHKRRDTNGMDCIKGDLPAAGDRVDLSTITSCIEVFSPEAALAVFTDRGGTHRWSADAATASLAVDDRTGDDTSVVLTQHVVRIDSGGSPYVLPAGEAFSFRVGVAVAPNRLPHPRWRDLRMFIWIGDGKHPYPSDAEIVTVAQLGFTLFQMHRLGTPGEPRPPASELERVLKTVHDTGMLFIWTANADLMYANAKGVTDLCDDDKWSRWQGFNYGGRYKDSMDPYCDLIATCLASPNGLADYRIQCKERMLEKYAVEGMYIDDNLPYANCTLWKEHGHPEKVYDCLIELHDMNWRRRQTLLSKCPHAVLIDHCTRGFILPTIAPFDVHLFGEGYSYASVETFWNTFGTLQNMPAQGCMWSGDTEVARCLTQVAYVFDLLTGGGQYSYLDWRLWPEKFPYASGVSPREVPLVRSYNLAQYYFGMYESQPYYFAQSQELFETTAPNTYATIYHNKTWNETLIALAGVNKAPTKTSLLFHKTQAIPSLAGERRFTVYDINKRTSATVRGKDMFKLFLDLALSPFEVRLLYIREAPTDAVYHQWGGKRISERWDASSHKLSLKIHGPVGLEDTVFLGTGGVGIERVTIDGTAAEFFVDPAAKMIHGNVTFRREPILLEVTSTPDGPGKLPDRAIVPNDPLQ